MCDLNFFKFLVAWAWKYKIIGKRNLLINYRTDFQVLSRVLFYVSNYRPHSLQTAISNPTELEIFNLIWMDEMSGGYEKWLNSAWKTS